MIEPEDQKSHQRPSCYGRLDCVFPKGQDDLRQSPPGCLDCPVKVECLRTAVQGKDGIAVKEEKLDRAYASGHIGFFERWAQKKKFGQMFQKKKFQQPDSRPGWLSNWLRRVRK